MKFLVVLLALAFAQDAYIRSSPYQHGDRDSASDYCAGLTTGSYVLCSSALLFQIVYSDFEGFSMPDLCYSGWTSDTSGDYQSGWFLNDENVCGGTVGWRTWAPSTGWGAHCCLDTVPGITPASCADLPCDAGTILVDDAELLFCASGTCQQETCCKAWEPAARYLAWPNVWGFPYDSPAAAEAACKEQHEDYQICSKTQIETLAILGEQMCSSGWYLDSYDESGDPVYDRGYYLNKEWSESGGCNGAGEGWKTWKDPNGFGSAHCCTAPYKTLPYGSVGRDNSTTLLQDSIDACAQETYTSNLCSSEQVHTISLLDDMGICTSAVLKSSLEDTAEAVIGWWQGNTACGKIGWRNWVWQYPGVHCCADYVPEFEYEILQYEYMPLFYGQSTYSTQGLAEAGCVGRGYDGLCKVEQVIWIATNEIPRLCIVGWVRNLETPGYWNTAGNCGSADTWNDAWRPATPVAFCCQDTTPELPYVTILDPYYNGGWDYGYSSSAEAEAMCDAGNGYSLCTKGQVQTIAVVGVERSDGTLQQETNICKYGWVEGDEAGWYQVDDTVCGGIAGWRTLNSASGTYHCCLDFEEVGFDPTAEPTPLYVAPAAFVQATAWYEFKSLDEAREACTELDPGYTLCSSAQVVEVALKGAAGDDTYTAVEAQTALCHSAWLETDAATCDDAIEHGWYRVDAGCGGPNVFKYWVSKDAEDIPTAGAYCCAPSIIPASDYREELGCPIITTTTDDPTKTPTVPPTVATTTGAPTKPVTPAPTTSQPTVQVTDPPTKPPVPTEQPTPDPTTASGYDPVPDDVLAALGVDSANLLIGDSQYYLYDGTNFVPTCVAYGAPDEACDNESMVCAGALLNSFGDYEKQGLLLEAALAEEDNKHPRCPPSTCVSSTVFAPEGFESDVSYCVSEGCYYMNGVATCVCEDTSTDVAADLENVWSTTFELSQCEDTRPFDEIMTDQLYITDKMVDSLEDQVNGIPLVDQQLAEAQDQLKTIWDNWNTEIEAVIDSAVAEANSNGNTDLAASLEQIIEDLQSLSA